MSEYQTLQISVSDGVATITLHRPDAANTMNLDLVRELLSAAIRCDEDRAIRAVVLTATGKMFCGGGDLPSFAAAGDGVGALIKQITTYLHSAVSRLVRMEKPLLTAVNGAAAGATEVPGRAYRYARRLRSVASPAGLQAATSRCTGTSASRVARADSGSWAVCVGGTDPS